MSKKKLGHTSPYKETVQSFRHVGNKPFDFHKVRNHFAVQVLSKKLMEEKEDKPTMNIEINPELF